jgi:group I intron endonuclease
MDRRKELRREYEEIKKPIGVFKIVNKVNGKIFVGTGINLDAVFNSYKFQMTYGVLLQNRELSEDWKKYGEENFSFEILDLVKQNDDPEYNYKHDLKILEELWLDELQPYGEKGYNRKPVKK